MVFEKLLVIKKSNATIIFIFFPIVSLCLLIPGLVLHFLTNPFGLALIIFAVMVCIYPISWFIIELHVYIQKKRIEKFKEEGNLEKLLKKDYWLQKIKWLTINAIKEIADDEVINEIKKIMKLNYDNIYGQRSAMILGFIGENAINTKPVIKQFMNDAKSRYDKYYYAYALTLLEGKTSEGLVFIEQEIEERGLDEETISEIIVLYQTLLKSDKDRIRVQPSTADVVQPLTSEEKEERLLKIIELQNKKDSTKKQILVGFISAAITFGFMVLYYYFFIK